MHVYKMENVIMFVLIIFSFIFISQGVKHGRNLIWSMSPTSLGVSRIVGIEGDPNDWVKTGNVTVRHISAPHYGWQFRALGFHYTTKSIFWSEKSYKRIQELTLDGSTATRSLFTKTSGYVDGLVIDWISDNMYFSDSKYNWIIMVPLNSTEVYYKLIITTGLYQPHGLAIYPKKGYLFWSDWGDIPKIEMSDLTGGNRRILVNDNIVHPRGITVDYEANAIYWVDSSKDTVETVEFNGNNRRIVLSLPNTNFFGIALYENFIFMTEQEEGHLKIYDKITGKGYTNYKLGYIPFAIMMYDEDMQAGEPSYACTILGCEQMCVDKPAFDAVCLCGEGYELNADKKTCTEVQEFIQPSHIYAIRDAICQYPANLADMSLANITLETQCFIKIAKGYLALSYDSINGLLYYSENVTRSIGRVQLRRGSFTDTIIRGVGEIRGLAYDWTSGNLYWTDNTYKWIMVSTANGKYQKVIVDGLISPIGIAVHPNRGTLYWADPGRSVIESSYMNGDNRTVLPIEDISHPNHLFIDFRFDELFWADSGLNQVSSFNLKTGEISVRFRQQSSTFFGLSIYQDYLIWTDQDKNNGIHVADISTGKKMRGILHPPFGQANDVISYDKANQPQFNVSCGNNNGNCEQICLQKKTNVHYCECGLGYTLSDDGRSCNSEIQRDDFLVVADSYQQHLYQIGMKTGKVNPIVTSELYRPIAVGYDPVTQKVHWTDNEAKVVKSASIYGTSEIVLQANPEVSTLDGLAVDYINRLLFITDTGLNQISVLSLSQSKYNKVIISEKLDQPRAIVVHPWKGRLYWSDWGDDARIETAAMDGSDRYVLVNFTTKSWPNGITIDTQENKLYWVDAFQDKIEVMDLKNSDITVVLQEEKAHYFGIVILGDYLYFTCWIKNYISRIPKSGGVPERVGPKRFARLNGIAGYSSSKTVTGTSICTAKCHHLCLPVSEKSYKCACADGYTLAGKVCRSKGNNTTDMPGKTSKHRTNIDHSGLPVAGIVAVVCACLVLAACGSVAGIYAYRRWRSPFIPHNRLIEDSQVDTFYRITFPDKNNRDEPGLDSNFDSGIENPSYDKMEEQILKN
ncbi:low-density lipoprotein receptor-related protein 4-like isoform X2 [Mytilus californianus]|uniref:low-density lipoprotein receptor-related protein 4-like isoform X2 n=1 Tax=Mytilus californianus TaxID=6549 RepID=UPI002248722B|nr:low-density lipoprotein receptor-related protein 4-like isoform X2 [Mytilus californianus]